MELKTIVFDWGDTLMVNLPEYDGAMKNWPVVKAVSGIKQVLETLSKKYQLVAASNAVDSNANDVRMALKRENLNEYFDKVYTASELGSRKPHKEFFFKIQESVGVTAQECVMVGDSWADDVNGALSAGWKAIWFNRNIQPCPALSPHHHAEYYQTHELIAIINHELLPDWNTCETWMRLNSHSLRLWLHVQLVAGISYTLALRLKQQGRDVSPILAQRGGLLHDIAKLSSIGKVHSKSHSEMGWEILNSYGQPKLAEISRRHILHAIQDPQLKPQSWEEKIVFYADKLAEGSHLVSLDERVEALKQRYGQWADNIQNSLPALYQLQTELAGALNLPEQEILPYLQKAFNGQPN